MRPLAVRRALSAVALCGGLTACGPTPDPTAAPIEVTVPDGAAFAEVVDSLHARGIVTRPGLFTLFARWKKLDTEVRAGRYALVPGTKWQDLLTDLTRGRVVMMELTIPEGWAIRQIIPRIAAFTDQPEEAVRSLVTDPGAADRYGVPGPGLEGYLLPETYHFAEGTSPEAVIEALIAGYREFWTPARRARLDSLGLDERELTTLASIVQAEARVSDEMPLIAAVYHNRLVAGWPLQADPTVLYALGGPRERLLYAAMDSVADSPYNTYTHPGLPPGPIGAPGTEALEATLSPADEPLMFFVAGTDGRHVFSRTLAEHNRAVAELRRRQGGGGTAP